jgi:hypothetical protein
MSKIIPNPASTQQKKISINQKDISIKKCSVIKNKEARYNSRVKSNDCKE